MRKALRFYELLGIIVEKDWEKLPLEFFEGEVDAKTKEEVIQNIQELFPNNFLISSLFEEDAVMLLDTSFAFNEKLFIRRNGVNEEYYINTGAIKNPICPSTRIGP